MKNKIEQQRWRAVMSAVWLGGAVAVAAPTQVLVETSFGNFANGEFKSVALDQEGILRPAPALDEGLDLGSAVAWTAVADGQGGHYVALGTDAKVVRRTAAGEVATVHTFTEGLVRALAVTPDGSLFVGTSIPAKIYRLNADGRAEIWHEAAESYIWDLLPEADGGLLVATGAPGKVYRLAPGHRPGDTPEAWWTAPGGQVTGLVRGPDGTVFAGTSGDGLLVRLNGTQPATMLWATEGAEVRAILPGADGTVFFATFPTPSAAAASSAAAAAAAASATGATTSASATSSSAATATSGPSASEPPPPPGGGALLRRDPDGFVRAVWAPPRGGIFSLREAPGGGFLVGTNDAGRIYRVQEDGTWSLLQQAPQGSEVSRFPAPGDAGVAVLTSHPARWYQLGTEPAAQSTYTSTALDARQAARWASLQAEDAAGRPAEIGLRARTGHTVRPGPTWSEWVDLAAAEPGRWVVDAEPARYLQYEISFASPSTSVRRLRAFARTANQNPILAGVRVLPIAMDINQTPAQPPNVDLRRLVEERQVENLVRDPASARLQFRYAPRDREFTLAWRAADPDGDDLRFRVSLQSEATGGWLVVADDLVDSWVMVPTVGLPEGLYRARVEASDAVDNDAAEARTAVRESEPFLLDLTPPAVTTEATGDRRWRVTAVDALSLLRRAWYQVDGGDEVRLRPEDGVFDQRTETFVLDGSKWPEDAASVRVFVEDEAGRVGFTAWTLL